MRYRNPQKINDHLWFLGSRESCVYLLRGSKGFLLISGGLVSIIPDVLRQLENHRIDPASINGLLVLHTHFDHVGIVPFFKRLNPKMTVYASPRAIQIFNKPKAIKGINAASCAYLKTLGQKGLLHDFDFEWRIGMSFQAVSEGDIIDLGDMHVRVIETPGHSPCSISAYVPAIKALFPSDAGGIPYGDRTITYGTSNYTQFQKSLEKMVSLEVKYLCSDHYGYVSGTEARHFIARSSQEADRRRALMADAFARKGNLEDAAQQLAVRFREENSGEVVPFDIFVESFRQMIRHVTAPQS